MIPQATEYSRNKHEKNSTNNDDDFFNERLEAYETYLLDSDDGRNLESVMHEADDLEQNMVSIAAPSLLVTDLWKLRVWTY